MSYLKKDTTIKPTNMQRLLPANLSPLWEADGRGLFCLRYLDINRYQQQTLATRIKAQSPIKTLRRQEPTVDKIKELLAEINPIIIAESTYGNRRTFGTYHIYTLHGYNFTQLCRSLYQVLCKKTPLQEPDFQRIVYLTTRKWETAQAWSNRIYNQNNEERQQQTEIIEIGLNDIENIRRNHNIPTTETEEESQNTIDEERIEELLTRTPLTMGETWDMEEDLLANNPQQTTTQELRPNQTGYYQTPNQTGYYQITGNEFQNIPYPAGAYYNNVFHPYQEEERTETENNNEYPL